MRILALNGSHRGKNGCTQLLLDQLAAGARAAGAKFETVALVEQVIKPCTGCETCHTPDHHLHCIWEEQDDVKKIFDQMRVADLVIYASPVYVFGVTGIMKTFLDRFNWTAGSSELCLTKSGLFFHKVDPQFHSKPLVVLTCCGNVEEETYRNVVSYFRTFAKFLDAPIVGTLVRTNVGMLETDGDLKTAKCNPIVEQVLGAYRQAGRELAMAGRISAGTEQKANQNLLGIPCLGLLMKFRFFKEMALRRKRK